MPKSATSSPGIPHNEEELVISWRHGFMREEQKSKVFEPNSVSKYIEIASNLRSFLKHELGKDHFSQPLPIFLHHKALLLSLIIDYLILLTRTDHESLGNVSESMV